MEIERKYTIKQMPSDLERWPHRQIEQFYLCGDPVLRCRRMDNAYILTYKSPHKGDVATSQEGAPCVNEELEAALTPAGYQHLKVKRDGFVIRKNRYLIPLEDGLCIELDVFLDQLAGLVFAEVEFPDVERAASFVPPAWFDQDVSQDHRYSNQYLSTVEKYTGWK